MQVRLAALIAFMFAGFATSAQAAVIVNAVEVGGNVVISGSGTLNLGAWTGPNDSGDFSRIDPSSLSIVLGPTPFVAGDRHIDPQNFAGPSGYGAGGGTNATSGTGDLFGFAGSFNMNVPDGYESGDPLSGSATYAGTDFATLGMDLGTYTWTWGSGGTADSFTLNVVPEPSTATLTALGLIGLAARRRRS
jgi:hypothetical protein